MSLLALALAASMAWGQVRTSSLPVVQQADTIRPTLDAWRKALQTRYEQGGLIQPRFSQWFEIRSDELKTLFPNYRFAVITWDEMEHPQAPRKIVGRAFGLHTTLAIDSVTGKVTEFFGYGNYEPFGAFLSERSVQFVAEGDARRVWVAFCQIHQMHWQDYGIVHPEKSIWHLGVKDIDDYRYYYEVNLDSDNKVVKGKLHAVKREKG